MPRRPKVPVQRVSLDRMLGSFVVALEAEGRSPATVYSYRLSVELLADFVKQRGHDGTVNVARDDIRAFLVEQATPRTIVDSAGRKHRGGSPATAAVRFKSLRRFFNFVVGEDELDVSPMSGMKPPTVEAKPVPVVDDDTLKALLKARTGKSVEDRRDAALLRVFLDTGCRLAEVTNLRRCDLDLKRQVVTVTGKGRRTRHVPFGAATALALDRYLRALDRERPSTWSPLDDDEPDTRAVWHGRQGPMTTSGITDVLHRVCKDAGVPQLHPHQFRHTLAASWLAAGHGEGDLMELAGWRSRSMLDRYGAYTRNERAQQAHRRASLGTRV